ncbi:hypothetical protein MNBD_GAMMA11-2885 [hydrothermal vent metagenome]|uniref:Uncharacterized protein n=1 Tax=hydrothermal vent metagenome TaxID=652676 RepID=A0A3B0WPM4_9ZZZZ
MRYLNITVLMFLFFIVSIQLCYAGDKEKTKMALARQLTGKFLLAKAVIDESDLTTVKQGDFNGDGIKDIAVVFLPVAEIKSENNITVQTLWADSVKNLATKYYKSIGIFHGSKVGWLSDSIRVSVLLAGDGVLEVPAFELLSARVGSEDYQQYYAWRPIELKGDFLIVPTEAGIDTYVYWNKDRYELLWPDEIP